MADQSTPVALVALQLAKTGIGAAFACDLKRITRKRNAFKNLKAAYLRDYGVDFEVTSSSTGKEPCVLAKFADGSTSTMLDARDLAIVDGDAAKFDKTLRAKMFLFF